MQSSTPQVVDHTQKTEPKKFETDEKGLMSLKSLDSQLAFAQSLLRSGTISNSFKTPQQVVTGIQYALSIGIDPRIALNEMFVLNGKPTLYAKGPASICRASGKLSDMKEFYVDKEMNKICLQNKNLNAPVYAAVCRVLRRGESDYQEDYFTIDDMNAAQLNSPVWKKYRRIMMRYRARALALNSAFQDVLNGIDIAEYNYDTLPEEGLVKVNRATDLSKKLLTGDAGEVV